MSTALREADYLKFLICARRKREDTQERYFYEWGNIHVALMLTTPEVMQVFQRYVQHYTLNGVSNDSLIYPLSEMGWDNMADHWLKTHDDFIIALTADGYVQRIQPHKFGDNAFELALVQGTTVFKREGYRPGGGVKLINWLKRRPGVTVNDFNAHFRTVYGPTVASAAGPALLRKYVQNIQLPLDKERFRGTLFERGDVAKFDAVEELWFDSLEDLARLKSDKKIFDAIVGAADHMIDHEHSFAMVTTERTVFDYATGEYALPQPAILNPNSLEALITAQGASGWNRPMPTADDIGAKKAS